MRYVLSILILAAPLWAQSTSQQPAPAQSASAPMRTEFRVQYVNGNNAYIDGGRDAGLSEGTALVLKQDPTKNSGGNTAIEPGILAKLKVVAIASASAVCEVEVSSRNVTPGDVLSLPDIEVSKLVEKNALGNTRQYPMVIREPSEQTQPAPSGTR